MKPTLVDAGLQQPFGHVGVASDVAKESLEIGRCVLPLSLVQLRNGGKRRQ
jgi:hypothetical protein